MRLSKGNNMEIIAGKEVLTTLEELVDPKRAAVIVVDVQHNFCSPGGSWAKQGYDLSMMETVIPNIARLLAAAREHGVRIIYIQAMTMPGLASVSPSQLRFKTQKCGFPPVDIDSESGTWGTEILPEVAPQPEDLIIPKWRSSAFVGTQLDLVLRSSGIESVIVCGVATNACVESTIRDAFNTDFYVVEVEDAVGAYERRLHEASITVMRTRVDVVSCDDVIGAWKSGAATEEITGSVVSAGSTG